jgi:hypothetical protein
LWRCVAALSYREAARRLFETAEQQQGFFTAKQAKAAGFAENMDTRAPRNQLARSIPDG